MIGSEMPKKLGNKCASVPRSVVRSHMKTTAIGPQTPQLRDGGTSACALERSTVGSFKQTYLRVTRRFSPVGVCCSTGSLCTGLPKLPLSFEHNTCAQGCIILTVHLSLFHVLWF
jgi:hypothetical protein